MGRTGGRRKIKSVPVKVPTRRAVKFVPVPFPPGACRRGGCCTVESVCCWWEVGRVPNGSYG